MDLTIAAAPRNQRLNGAGSNLRSGGLWSLQCAWHDTNERGFVAVPAASFLCHLPGSADLHIMGEERNPIVALWLPPGMYPHPSRLGGLAGSRSAPKELRFLQLRSIRKPFKRAPLVSAGYVRAQCAGRGRRGFATVVFAFPTF